MQLSIPKVKSLTLSTKTGRKSSIIFAAYVSIDQDLIISLPAGTGTLFFHELPPAPVQYWIRRPAPGPFHA